LLSFVGKFLTNKSDSTTQNAGNHRKAEFDRGTEIMFTILIINPIPVPTSCSCDNNLFLATPADDAGAASSRTAWEYIESRQIIVIFCIDVK
jgi:hypothetical protein